MIKTYATKLVSAKLIKRIVGAVTTSIILCKFIATLISPEKNLWMLNTGSRIMFAVELLSIMAVSLVVFIYKDKKTDSKDIFSYIVYAFLVFAAYVLTQNVGFTVMLMVYFVSKVIGGATIALEEHFRESVILVGTIITMLLTSALTKNIARPDSSLIMAPSNAVLGYEAHPQVFLFWGIMFYSLTLISILKPSLWMHIFWGLGYDGRKHATTNKNKTSTSST